MPQFIFSYRQAQGDGGAPDPEVFAAWEAFFNDVIAPNLVDPGWPVREPAVVLGKAGGATQLGGYSIIEADDLETAVSLARRCPAIEHGGGVEVGVLAALPADHAAEQLRSRRSRA